MGLRDRLRLLVRPPPAPAAATPSAAAPAPSVAAPRLVIPRAVPAAPVGARLVHVGPGPVRPGAERIEAAGVATGSGPRCFVSNDGGRAASAAAERAASQGGHDVTWLVEAPT